MQAEVDSLQVEVSRRESNIDMVNTEKERILNRLKAEEGLYKDISNCKIISDESVVDNMHCYLINVINLLL